MIFFLKRKPFSIKKELDTLMNLVFRLNEFKLDTLFHFCILIQNNVFEVVIQHSLE